MATLQFDRRRRTRVAATVLAARQPKQRGQSPFERLEALLGSSLSGLPSIDLQLGANCEYIDRGDPALTAAPIDPPEPLDHALIGHQVAHHVVRVQVHTDLTCGGRDEIGRRSRRGLRATEESVAFEPRLQIRALVHPAFTDKKLRYVAVRQLSCPSPFRAFLVNRLLHRDCVRPAVAVDEHARWGVSVTEFNRATGDALGQLPFVLELNYFEALPRRQTLVDHRLLSVPLLQPEHGVRRNLHQLAPGCGQRHQAERRCERLSPRSRTELPVATGHDLAKQRFERRTKVRFVQQNQRVDAKEARVVGPHASRYAVAFEQQPGADHVDRPDHDRGH